jgi:hypothetical protein
MKLRISMAETPLAGQRFEPMLLDSDFLWTLVSYIFTVMKYVWVEMRIKFVVDRY